MSDFYTAFEQAFIEIVGNDKLINVSEMFQTIYNNYHQDTLKQLFFLFLDMASESTLDILAKNYDISVYDVADTIEMKREFVKNGMILNRKAGTNWAIEKALGLRGHNASVKEGACPVTLTYDGTATYNGIYDYSGGVSALYSWAFFGVLIDLGSGGGLSSDELIIIERIIKKYKPVWAVYHCLKSGYVFTDEYNRLIQDEITKIDVGISYIELGLIAIRYDGTYIYDGTIKYDNYGINETLTITAS